ncbi:MAG: tellurium resistance protein TerC [Geobacteraceae bacterium GWC2_55_20]|nr:MAG: tellurium resistance protein TerC [Geobacteraceae bacterium GWC2_55_20]HBA71019.1 tellurium resistance protein TerC [Geobacter sp.]HCE69414.1 tellurium resistance protein TerC [Geobacter sp.]
MSIQADMWLAFGALVIIMLFIDLGLSRKSHEISFREALTWTVVWISLAMIFNFGVYHYLGRTKALEFFTGYVIEKSLSVDNLFVFIMIFSYFNIPRLYQPKILKWGIIGALVLRAVFIFAGIELLAAFHWMIYIFGGILIVTGIKMAFGGEEKLEPEKNLLVKLVRRYVPITKRLHGNRFFINRRGVRATTPLFLALLLVEWSDVIFALDSLPAVFAVTRDPFIVYTSNVFAILGLRALFFLLSRVMGMFTYLKLGISFVLAFVGVKMLLADTRFEIPVQFSLGVIFGALLISITISILMDKRGGKSGQE